MTADKAIQSIEDVLEECGVTETTLTPEVKRALDEQGYVLFENLIGAIWLEELRSAYEGVIKREGKSAGVDHHQEEGARRIGDLVNKGAVFDRLYTHPTLLAATHHILGCDFKLGAMSGRDPLPGFGIQGYHLDTSARKNPDDPYKAVSIMILLDNFTTDNGTTRIIPGTHKKTGVPSEHIKDPSAPHSDEVRVVAPASTVLCFNAHLFHAGTTNSAGTVRRMIHVFYQERTQPSWLDQSEYIRKRTYDRISPAARYLLDV